MYYTLCIFSLNISTVFLVLAIQLYFSYNYPTLLLINLFILITLYFCSSQTVPTCGCPQNSHAPSRRLRKMPQRSEILLNFEARMNNFEFSLRVIYEGRPHQSGEGVCQMRTLLLIFWNA